MIKTFAIQTLGCKVNQYESDQLAALLRGRGLTSAEPARADLRVVNTCSVTVQAASKSRQLTRRGAAIALPQFPTAPPRPVAKKDSARQRLVVTGCWATSDPSAAAALPDVDAVLGHHHDVAAELNRLLDRWQGGTSGGEGWQLDAGRRAGIFRETIEATAPGEVNEKPADSAASDGRSQAHRRDRPAGTTTLPLLGERQPRRQRAYLKIQDGCDAHCTYCIIPSLRPAPWSKPIDDAVEEVARLVAAGHVEIVLTGIFLGAYGQPTALRRRQAKEPPASLAKLIDALCARVPGLRRLRLSSLEPGDLTDDLATALRGHEQVVPHFHLPLQSGSDALLRRMNRQYGRDDFLRMIDRVRAAFDRPALTTDVIVGFPGEGDAEFDQTMEVVDRAAFIHVHAFSFSPRPGTAAARWTRDFVRGPVVNERIERLRARSAEHSFAFRRQFLGERVELLVERERDGPPTGRSPAMRHGRCARYFDVSFGAAGVEPGDFVTVRIDDVTPTQTTGQLIGPEGAG